MRGVGTLIVSFALVLGLGDAAQAAKARKRTPAPEASQYNSPSAIHERQRNRATFDPSQYYERDSNRIPFGTQTWWDQKTLEGQGP